MGLEFFRCQKREMTLSKVGCGRLYAAANLPKPPDPWRGIAGCRACSLGAYHATGQPQNPLIVLSEIIRMLCPRCGRPSAGLINGTLCRSCHARHLEAIAKKNAKGHEPALTARLHTQRIAVSDDQATRIVTQRGVASIPEFIIHQSKAATGPTAFGRRIASWRNVPQLEMAL